MEDHTVLHVYRNESSSESSLEEDEVPLLVNEGLVVDQELLNFGRWNPLRTVGKRFSARLQGNTSEEGSLWRNPDPSEPQEKRPASDNPNTDHSESALRGDQLSQAQALPVSETPRERKLGENPRQFVTFGQTPSQEPELEWESPVLSNSPFTPGFPLHHVGLARQFDKRPEDTVLFQSEFAKQLETERRMSSIPMTDPQSETNQN